MADGIRVGIMGGGWPGAAHAKGYAEAGGFKILAVADLIPDRRRQIMAQFAAAREYADAREMLANHDIDAVSICLPNSLHSSLAIEALRAGKHVICEMPPAVSEAEARKMDSTARRAGKVLLYAAQRRFGPHAQAAQAAIAKDYAGQVYHARAAWTRTRGIPQGTGWFTQKQHSGGGALIDIGIHMLDLAWHLLGQPKPLGAFGLTHRKFASSAQPGSIFDVEDAAFAMLRFEGDKSIELAASWAINQPKHQDGAVCRIYGDKGTVDVFTPQGAVLYRNFSADGEYKEHPLKPPKLVSHAALMRHFRNCIAGKATPMIGGPQGVTLMKMIEAIYQSDQKGKSASIAGE